MLSGDIIEAFFTTKEAKGCGIGLWLSGEMLGKHGSYMRVFTRTPDRIAEPSSTFFLPLTGRP